MTMLSLGERRLVVQTEGPPQSIRIRLTDLQTRLGFGHLPGVTLLHTGDEASLRLPILPLVHLHVSFSIFSSNFAFENIFDLLFSEKSGSRLSHWTLIDPFPCEAVAAREESASPHLFASHTKQQFCWSHQAMRFLKLAQCLSHLPQQLLLLRFSELPHHISGQPACCRLQESIERSVMGLKRKNTDDDLAKAGSCEFPLKGCRI
jgi:hypothetical protein